MARNGPYLFPTFPHTVSNVDWEQLTAEFAARFPAAQVYTEDEVTEFFAVARHLRGYDNQELVKHMARRGIRIPVAIRFDYVRLRRFLIYQWKDPRARETLIAFARDFDHAAHRKKVLKSSNWVHTAIDGMGPLPGAWYLAVAGAADRVPELLASLDEEQLAWRLGQLNMGRVWLHRCLTEPDLFAAQLTRTEQKALIRRMTRRELQLRSLRRSAYQLRMERKALLRRIREPEERAKAQLMELKAQLAAAEAELAAEEVRHAEQVAALLTAQAAEIDELQGQLNQRQEECAAALAERNAWMPIYLLTGKTVAVIGDEGRAPQYRLLIESAGGRMVAVSGLEKLNRVADVVGHADVVIMMTGHAKHAAEYSARKMRAGRAAFFRCGKSGVGAFERLLRTEVMPRLVTEGAASARMEG